MLINNKFIHLSKKFDLYFSNKNSLLYLKGLFGIISIKLPSHFFFDYNDFKLSFIFLNNYFFKSFLSQFTLSYRYLFFFHFVKLKIKGLGYRIKKMSDNLLRFFFGSTNFFYFHIPFNVIAKIKKRRILLVSNNLIILKTLLAHLLLLKKLNVYRIRGLVYPRQIITLKIGKKNL